MTPQGQVLLQLFSGKERKLRNAEGRALGPTASHRTQASGLPSPRVTLPFAFLCTFNDRCPMTDTRETSPPTEEFTCHRRSESCSSYCCLMNPVVLLPREAPALAVDGVFQVRVSSPESVSHSPGLMSDTLSIRQGLECWHSAPQSRLLGASPYSQPRTCGH